MRACLLIVAALYAVASTSAASDGEAVELYLQKVKPALAARCFACHGALKQEGNLRLDSVQHILRGGDSGAAVVSKDRPQSLLLQRVTSTNPSHRMPQEGEPLKPEQIEAIAIWIDLNASGPVSEQAELDPRDHWAFRPIVRTEIPADPSNWTRTTVDNFVALSHRKHQLKPQPSASDLLLVRRLYIDLIGLPPKPADLASIDFSNKQWYDELVSQLLQDPRYGERWARHWMDIWRYSDWWGLGDQLRNSQYHMWHWRDWIIQSLNQDQPLDEMIRQMLAADELYPEDLDKIRATGFLARNYFLFNRNPWMEETVEHVSKSLLGLTMNCTKCHDHKYDPFDQVDFYRLRAFFEPYFVRLDMLPDEIDLNKNGIPRVFDAVGDWPTYRYERGDEAKPDKSTVIAPGVPAIFQFRPIEIQPVALPQSAWQPEHRQWVTQNYLAHARSKIDLAQQTVVSKQRRLAELQAKKISQTNNSDPPTDLIVAEQELKSAGLELQLASDELCSIQARANWMASVKGSTGDHFSTASVDGQPASSVVDSDERPRIDAVKSLRRLELTRAKLSVVQAESKLQRSQADNRKKLESELEKVRQAESAAQAKFDAAVGSDEQPPVLSGARWTATRFFNSTADDPTINYSPQSTGRRTALAQWITDRQNPLTARVAVNHMWNRHFGSPLVATVFDFGRNGAQPTNQPLLDWLASELIDSGWSMKHVHSLIVRSNTYRLSSSTVGAESNIKIDPDNQYWWRRNPIRIESQAVRDGILYQAGELDQTLYGPSIASAQQAQSRRRSLYFFHSNNDRNQFLTAFDEASVKECYRRDQSIVPQQALALVNSNLVLQTTGKIAQQLSQGSDDPQSFIFSAFRILLGFEPGEKELNLSLEALRQWQAIEGFTMDQSRQMLVWTLVNHNDFVTLR